SASPAATPCRSPPPATPRPPAGWPGCCPTGPDVPGHGAREPSGVIRGDLPCPVGPLRGRSLRRGAARPGLRAARAADDHLAARDRREGGPAYPDPPVATG